VNSITKLHKTEVTKRIIQISMYVITNFLNMQSSLNQNFGEFPGVL